MIWLWLMAGVLAVILLSPLVLIAVLRPALMAVDGGSRHPCHVTAALIGWVADTITAWTLWAMVAGWPKQGEKTISDTLERLAAPESRDSWRYPYAVALSLWINERSPTNDHIASVSVPLN